MEPSILHKNQRKRNLHPGILNLNSGVPDGPILGFLCTTKTTFALRQFLGIANIHSKKMTVSTGSTVPTVDCWPIDYWMFLNDAGFDQSVVSLNVQRESSVLGNFPANVADFDAWLTELCKCNVHHKYCCSTAVRYCRDVLESKLSLWDPQYIIVPATNAIITDNWLAWLSTNCRLIGNWLLIKGNFFTVWCVQIDGSNQKPDAKWRSSSYI